MQHYQDRFEAKFVRSANSCWIWIAAYDRAGYGYFQLQGVCQKAHRVSYELYKGPIPEGMMVCHTCNIPSCVNPEHLYLGSALTNAQDKARAGNNANSNKTHCKRGHEYNEANTHVTGKGERQCRICGRDAARARRNVQAT